MSLPRLVEGICVSSYQNGIESPPRYLVEVGARSFLLHAPTVALLEALRRSDDPDQVASTLSEQIGLKVNARDVPQMVSALPPALFNEALAKVEKTNIDFRCTLITAESVVWLATRCTRLFSLWVVVAFSLLTVIVFPLLWRSVERGVRISQVGWTEVAIVGIGFVMGAVIHELGHATALMKHGEKPGRIGIGIYWFWPVFFTDVNAAWRLAPRQRISVDVGGLYFQIWFLLGVLLLTYCEPVAAAGCLVIVLGSYSVLHSLNPVFKTDGYWLLADALRLSSLHDQALGILHERQRLFSSGKSLILFLYGLVVCLYFCYLAVVIPPTVGRWAQQLGEAVGQIDLNGEVQKHDLGSTPTVISRFWVPVKNGFIPLVSLSLLGLWMFGLIRRTKNFVTFQWKLFRSAQPVG